MSLEMLQGLRYVGYPEDCLMLADGTVLCEFSTGRARMERGAKDSCGKAIEKAILMSFAETGIFDPSCLPQGHPGGMIPKTKEEMEVLANPVKRGPGRPPKVK